MSMFNGFKAHKKSCPKLSGWGKLKVVGVFLTHSNITCNCKNQNPPFCESERKPDFVIKLFHYHAGKIEPSNHCFFIMELLYPERVGESKKNRLLVNVSSC